MITNTHLLFSRLIFKHCLNELDFKLCKGIFMYGNIKPDIFSEQINDSHSLEDSTAIVQEYINKLTSDKLTIQQFSLVLGMLCHYTCDFFCIYHCKEFKDKSILKHIIYEIKLHFKLIVLLITGGLKLINNIDFPEKDILSMILEMQKKYSKEKESGIKDITYAISAAICISESVLQFRSIKAENREVINNNIYKLPKGVRRDLLKVNSPILK